MMNVRFIMNILMNVTLSQCHIHQAKVIKVCYVGKLKLLM
jgi:hypothetical protein